MTDFNDVNPVSIGATAKVNQYARVFNNTLAVHEGKQALPGQSAGDLKRALDGAEWERIPGGDDGQVLTMVGGVPTWVDASGGGLAICEGRLTLTSGTPVTVADVNGATSVYLSPYKGNHIRLYDGAAWNVRAFTEITISLSGFTGSKIYDIFAYDNSGIVTIETLVWTNDSTRATALTLQDGVPVKTGAVTRRYLGSVYINAAGGQATDSVLNRGIWNYYHRRRRILRATDSTNSWAGGTANTWRQARAAAGNQFNFLIGVAEESLSAKVLAFADGGGNVRVGVGLDTTSAVTSGGLRPTSAAASGPIPVTGELEVYPAAGWHFASWNEYTSAGASTTWYGDDNAPAVSQSGIHGVIHG